jgi:hypothetical protein
MAAEEQGPGWNRLRGKIRKEVSDVKKEIKSVGRQLGFTNNGIAHISHPVNNKIYNTVREIKNNAQDRKADRQKARAQGKAVAQGSKPANSPKMICGPKGCREVGGRL